MTSTRTGLRTIAPRLARVAVWLLITIVLVFFVIRVTSDVSDLGSGRIPAQGDFDRRYVLNPVPAYLHIGPGRGALARDPAGPAVLEGVPSA